MNVLHKAKAHTNLQFLDYASQTAYSLEQITFTIPKIAEKSLFFLYVANTIDNVGLYLSLLNTKHTIALLNAQLDSALKEQLEAQYLPEYIVDSTRATLVGYTTEDYQSKITRLAVFTKVSDAENIHPNCKLLLSTSGTTGSPKFVKLSEVNLMANAKAIASYLPILDTDVTPLNLPIHYSYGLSVLHSNIISGADIVCGLPDILQREFWSAMEAYKFTSIAGVPFVYEMLKRIGFLKKVHPGLRYITQAGGNLKAALKTVFLSYCKENDVQFYVMYGQTEATARIAYVPEDHLEEKITAIGIAIPNGKLALDPETQELLYSGPNVFGGYATSRKDLKNWSTINSLATGDIATVDKDGYFYITGRIKRFVKIFGNRVNLDDIERFISNTYPQRTLACIGIDDTHILISYSGTELDIKHLKKTIFDAYKLHPNTIKVQQLAELPLTGNGKLDYKKIRQEYDV